MSKRQAILKTIWSPFTAVFRTKNCAPTASNLIVVVNAGGEITGGGCEDAIVTRKARSSLEDLLKIDASSPSNFETKAANEPQPNMARPAINFSKDSELQIVLAGFPKNGHGGVIAGRPPASLGGGGAVVVRAPTVRVKVNKLVVLVPAALRARSRAAKMVDAAALPTKRRSYWRIAGRADAGGDKSELFYQRPIPLGRRCRVQHLEEVTLSDN